jgi:hypothetical protein
MLHEFYGKDLQEAADIVNDTVGGYEHARQEMLDRCVRPTRYVETEAGRRGLGLGKDAAILQENLEREKQDCE